MSMNNFAARVVMMFIENPWDVGFVMEGIAKLGEEM